MNEWAAKQSFLRNRKNRLIHPNPELPAPLQALGYFFRVAIVVFILTIITFKLASNYYNGSGFSEDFSAELKDCLKAQTDNFEISNFSWEGDLATSKKIEATGSEEAFYRELVITKISFEQPLLKRIRGKWDISEVKIQEIDMLLKSGGKLQKQVGDSGNQGDIEMMLAGIFPSPKLAAANFKQIRCSTADLSWGLEKATRGAIEGSRLKLYAGTPNWRMDLEGGTLRQNWLRGLAINHLTVRREPALLTVSNSEVTLGKATQSGTLDGTVTLEQLPQLDLNLKLPEAHTRDMLTWGIGVPEYFYGVLDLSVNLTGSINTLAGVQSSGIGKFKSGTFNKIPVLEAVDQLLKMNGFRIFSIEEGEIEFSTGEGKLTVSKFSCKSEDSRIAVRGNFVYTQGITFAEAKAHNETHIGGTRQVPKPEDIQGSLQLGVPPKLVEGNDLAKSYFTESSDGYLWITIPLSGPLGRATKEQQAKILADLRAEK